MSKFKEGRYQLLMSPKEQGSELPPATLSQSGNLSSPAQVEAAFADVIAKVELPETHQFVFVAEGSDGWNDDFGADSNRSKQAEVPQAKTTDAFANLNDGVAATVDDKMTESQKSLLAGIQQPNPDGDLVMNVQKKIILDQHKKEYGDKVEFAKHLKKFAPTR